MSAPAYFPGYALLIGVGHTLHPPWSLPVSANDARALHALLSDPNRGGYDPARVRLLTDDAATKANILQGLNWLREALEAEPNNLALFFFSGHGALGDDGSFQLIPHNARPGNLGSALSATLLAEQLSLIEPRQLLAIFDCCHAAGMSGASGAQLGFHSVAAQPQLLSEVVHQRGRIALASSQPDQVSFIDAARGQSIFTGHLLEALAGAEARPGSKHVSFTRVLDYLSVHVPRTALELHGAVQEPNVNGASGDFPLALLNSGHGPPDAQTNPAGPTLNAATEALRELLASAESSQIVQFHNSAVVFGGGSATVSNDTRQPQPQDAPRLQGTVFALIGDARNEAELLLAAEAQALRKVFATAGELALSLHHATDRDRLARRVAEVRPVVLHLSGNGSGAGLALAGGRRLAWDELSDALVGLGGPLRCVVLNMPFADQATALLALAPVLVAANGPVSAAGKASFVRSFYGGLAGGKTIEHAFQGAARHLAERHAADAGRYRLLENRP